MKLENSETIPEWMVPLAETQEEVGVEKVEETDIISAAEQSLLQKVIRKGLVKNRNDLGILQKDPNSPLHAVKRFEDLKLYVFKFLCLLLEIFTIHVCLITESPNC